MLNEEYLKGLLGKEDVSAEDKIKQIIAEHEADTRGLVQKRDELLAKEVKFKEQISSFDAAKGDYEKKIAEMTEELKKASPEAHKQFYETQIADTKAKYEAELTKVASERDYYRQSHLNSLRDKAIEDGIKDLNFVPGLKDGFIARVLSMNNFEPQEIDGSLKFLNKEHHTIEEAINTFALSQEGKAYIANSMTGGGARGGAVGSSGSAKTMTRMQYENMAKENPQYVKEFFANGGRISG